MSMLVGPLGKDDKRAPVGKLYVKKIAFHMGWWVLINIQYGFHINAIKIIILTNVKLIGVCGASTWQGLTLDNKRATSITRCLPALLLHSFINSTSRFVSSLSKPWFNICMNIYLLLKFSFVKLFTWACELMKKKNESTWQWLTLDDKRAPSITRCLPALLSSILQWMSFEFFVKALFKYL